MGELYNLDPVFIRTRCYYCLNLKLGGEMRHVHHAEITALQGSVVDKVPCTDCAEHMRNHCLVSVYDPKNSPPNWNMRHSSEPRRTHFVIIRFDDIEAVLPPDEQALLTTVQMTRHMFVPLEHAKRVGIIK